ncbi:hypothetical protein [Amycolatopsis sp. NPDC057786]|uniref:hypothetical protein n=1 Tax=Amycolatopsis sp. NPDC057786 TaxID=3346250 RepID=UPI00366C6D44
MFGRMPGRDGGTCLVVRTRSPVTQGVVFLVLLLAVWKLPLLDWLGPARWGVPLSAIAVRRARIESRTPASWLIGLVTHLLAPSFSPAAAGVTEAVPCCEPQARR